LRRNCAPPQRTCAAAQAPAEASFDTAQEPALAELASTPFGWLLEFGDPSHRMRSMR